MNTEDRNETLLSRYATPEEIAEVQLAHAAIRTSELKEARVLAVLQETDRQIGSVRRAVGPNLARAAALALGEAVEDEDKDATPANPAQLEAQLKGLNQRWKDEQEMVAHQRGKFRGAVKQLLHTCAQRCAEDYQLLTSQQGWCWQQLHLAQELAGNAYPIVDHVIWNKYFVPSSTHLPALKAGTREDWGIPTLMSQDRIATERDGAMRQLAQHGKELFGEWPL